MSRAPSTKLLVQKSYLSALYETFWWEIISKAPSIKLFIFENHVRLPFVPKSYLKRSLWVICLKNHVKSAICQTFSSKIISKAPSVDFLIQISCQVCSLSNFLFKITFKSPLWDFMVRNHLKAPSTRLLSSEIMSRTPSSRFFSPKIMSFTPSMRFFCEKHLYY